jgi:NAD(P)-dependent dehydrogenase (short-subunit alcohol dehydrogenase family)
MTTTVLITGASSGIGNASAERFADEGWNVVATMRDPAKGEDLKGLADALVTRLDVRDRSSIAHRRGERCLPRREPVDDARFVAGFAHALEHTGGYTPEEARRVAGTLLPEILPYDPTRPASLPDNGRTLTDDAVDTFLAILTNGKVTEDKVGPHGDLLAEFPYLGPPHSA